MKKNPGRKLRRKNTRQMTIALRSMVKGRSPYWRPRHFDLDRPSVRARADG